MVKKMRKYVVVFMAIILVASLIPSSIGIIGLFNESNLKYMKEDISLLTNEISEYSKSHNGKFPLEDGQYYGDNSTSVLEKPLYINDMSGIKLSLRTILEKNEDREDFLYKIDLTLMEGIEDQLRLGKETFEGDFYVYSILTQQVYHYGSIEHNGKIYHSENGIKLEDDNFIGHRIFTNN